MGKAKKRKLANHRNPYASSHSTHIKHQQNPPKIPSSAQSQKPIIPFKPTDHILLLGEGDFSFAHALLAHHGCTSLIATSYDSLEQCQQKYPQSTGHIAVLEAEEDVKVLFNVDATKLSKAGKLISQAWFDVIGFNFPHVGGLTKDVNRQVRYNQELLVNFFRSAMPILAPLGSILITVFEGEPYELWNVRDLGRHVGLKVERSFRFQAGAYPGYRHARTLGNIDGGGGWKGEDRPARTFIFKKKDEDGEDVGGKRRRKDEDSDDEDG